MNSADFSYAYNPLSGWSEHPNLDFVEPQMALGNQTWLPIAKKLLRDPDFL